MRNNDPSPSCQQPASYTPAYDGIYSIIQGGSGALSDSSSRGRLGLSPLSTSLYRGLLPRQPEAYLIGNAYSSKLFWDEARRFSLEMTGVKGDLTRMTRWANKLFDNIANVRATTHTDKQTIERIFRSCGSTPTLIYINGHTDMINDERLYLPSDCSANGSCLATLGIPFRTMREWLVDGENLMELTIVTDICKCTNIFGLPFVAEKRNGVWVWTETSESFADGAIDQWDGTKVLHFASTSEDENAHECESAGGIYTRASTVDSHINSPNRSWLLMLVDRLFLTSGRASV
ncbi:hypothetical protein FRC07_000313 [Ceratobasidium sp. 392]|nr:hypothetical protein FRC07_000313 [Ceratobasidium sp. 392]